MTTLVHRSSCRAAQSPSESVYEARVRSAMLGVFWFVQNQGIYCSNVLPEKVFKAPSYCVPDIADWRDSPDGVDKRDLAWPDLA